VQHYDNSFPWEKILSDPRLENLFWMNQEMKGEEFEVLFGLKLKQYNSRRTIVNYFRNLTNSVPISNTAVRNGSKDVSNGVKIMLENLT
jgi:hypothetical protein